MRVLLAAACLAALSFSPAAAEPSKRSLALAQRYADAIHFERQLSGMMDAMLPTMVEQALKKEGLTLTSELKAVVGKVGGETMRVVSPKMLAVMIPVIAETYTEAELEAAITYLESPEGQSMLAKSSAFAGRVTPALVELTPVIEAAFQESFCREVSCEAE